MTGSLRPPVLLGDGTLPSAQRGLPVGWRVREGFALPEAPWNLTERRWVCAGLVAHEADAEAAALALSRGVGLVLRIEVGGDVRHRLLEDVHRFGDVRSGCNITSGGGLDREHRLLLQALADGSTVDEIARALHLSRRTVHRRLADLRHRLGVATTVEAVAWWRRNGADDPAGR